MCFGSKLVPGDRDNDLLCHQSPAHPGQHPGDEQRSLRALTPLWIRTKKTQNHISIVPGREARLREKIDP